jgi:hypothetical protein
VNADEFNALYEVGVPVFAYPGARPEDHRDARRLVTRTRSRASVLGGHTDVVWVEDHSACIALSHVDVVTEDEFKAAKLAQAVAEQGALPVPAGPSAVEYGIRFSDGSILRSDTPRTRSNWERRFTHYQASSPQARLVQRTVHYSDWTEADQ